MAGIDSIVNDRADMFAGNPQGLQQRYAMGQDLLDLLALQKLKKDKEAAQRSLQMQMQGPQGTVKDQLEGQVMDMTRQEVAQAMGPGIQQQGQQMAAQQAQQALSGGLPTQPAPNMVGMAQGGIVGYQEGGMPEGEEDYLDYGQIDPQMAGLRSNSVLKGLVEFFARKNAEAERYRRTGSTDQPAAEAQPPQEPAPVTVRGTGPFGPQQGIASVLPQREVNTRPTPQRAYTDAENEANVAAMTETLPAVQRAEPAAAPKDPRMSRYEDQLTRLEAEEKDKLGALIDFLLGAGASGGTTLGATMTGGGMGLRDRRERIKGEMAQTVKNIEDLQFQRDEMQARQEESAEDRALRLQLEQMGIRSDEKLAQADIASRQSLAEMDAQLQRELAESERTGRMSVDETNRLTTERNLLADGMEAAQNVLDSTFSDAAAKAAASESMRQISAEMNALLQRVRGRGPSQQQGGSQVPEDVRAAMSQYLTPPPQ